MNVRKRFTIALAVLMVSGVFSHWFAEGRMGTAVGQEQDTSVNGSRSGEPVNVIFDSDMDTDNDDASALAILHALADRGEAKILATFAVSSSKHAASCIDAINTYYGRGDLPVGAYKGDDLPDHSKYNHVVAKKCPHSLSSREEAPDAVSLYRRVLTSRPDDSVTIIAVGPMNNLANLLASKGDDNSSLTGRELVEKKVRALYVMGPYFNDEGTFHETWNFKRDPKAAIELLDGWPTPVKFGEGILGHRHFIGENLKETAPENPVRIAFKAFSGGTIEDRHCADPTTVMYAVRSTRHFDEIGPGRCVVRKTDGASRWVEDEKARHYYNVQKQPIDTLETVMEELLVKTPEAQKE